MNKKAVLFIFSLLMLPQAYALSIYDVDFDFARIFQIVGEFFYQIATNDYAMFGITVIVLTILLYSVYSAAISKVKMFEGGSGTGLSRPGQMLAWSLSLLSTLGIVWMKGDRDVGGFLEDVLGPGRIFAAIVLAVVVALWLKKSMGQHSKWSWLVAGLFCIVLAGMFKVQMLAPIGLIVAIIGLMAGIKGNKMTPRRRERAESRAQKKEVALGRELKEEERTDAEEEVEEKELAQEERGAEDLVNESRRETYSYAHDIDRMIETVMKGDRLGFHAMLKDAMRNLGVSKENIQRLKQGMDNEESIVKKLKDQVKEKRERLTKKIEEVVKAEAPVEELSEKHEEGVKKEEELLKRLHDDEVGEEVKIGHIEGVIDDIEKRLEHIEKMIDFEIEELGKIPSLDWRTQVNAIRERKQGAGRIDEAWKKQADGLAEINRLLTESYRLAEEEKKLTQEAGKDVQDTVKVEDEEKKDQFIPATP